MAWLLGLLLLLCLYWAAFLLLPVRGRAAQVVEPPAGFADRPRRVRAEVAFTLWVPAYWRLSVFALGRAGLQPREFSGLGFGRVGLSPEAEARPPKRGVYPLPAPELVLVDLFGLFRRRVQLATNDARLVVYPRRWPVLPPALRLTLLAEGPPAELVGLADPTRYRGARPYRPGDPWRRLHWKLTAKRGAPMVREYDPVRATGVWLYLDTYRASPVFVEHLAELAASLAVALEAEGLHVGLAWPGGRLPPVSGQAGMARLLTALAELGQSPEPAAPPLPPPGVNLFIFTQHAPLALIEGALKARARAAKVVLLLFPEGFFLRPGEKGRPIWGKTPGMARLLARRRLLAAAGVEVGFIRGKDRVRFF